MQTYRTTLAIRSAAQTHPDPELRQLLTERIHSLEAFDDLPGDLGNLLQVLVLEPGEGAADLEGVMGFSISHCRSTGVAFGLPGFCPAWEVFVPDTANAALLALCTRYAISAPESSPP